MLLSLQGVLENNKIAIMISLISILQLSIWLINLCNKILPWLKASFSLAIFPWNIINYLKTQVSQHDVSNSNSVVSVENPDIGLVLWITILHGKHLIWILGSISILLNNILIVRKLYYDSASFEVCIIQIENVI